MEPNSPFRSPDAKALFARNLSAGDSYREAVSFYKSDRVAPDAFRRDLGAQRR